MDTLVSLAGLVGAVLCVGMYALVSFGYASAERASFFIINAIGAALICVGASHEFDIGDLGTVGQEIVWAAISVAGAVRAWRRSGTATAVASG